MKTVRFFMSFSLLAFFVFLSLCCASKKEVVVTFLEDFSPEESGLNMTKITEESRGSIICGTASGAQTGSYAKTILGVSQTKSIQWNCKPYLSLSPDGLKIAHVSRSNNLDNIMVRSTSAQGVATQRSFRNVEGGIFWGNDNRLYFSDNNSPNFYISSMDAVQGSIMSQHTNGNVVDYFPALSSDSTILFFTRWQATYGPSIWALNLKDGTLSSCSRGFCVGVIPGKNDEFYCVRNTTDGRSEIWHVNYVTGKETIVLSDQNKGFTNPTLSPDGRWLLVVGNSESQITKKQNTDIYVVRVDGTHLTQLTYHPETDISPVWSKDGKYIYFISSRANKDYNFNIWRMNFTL